ncbi:hypothetical protein WJX72_008275 [[Myrmecia] bisecta]|uniref:Protein kinase domain-containing protein n=1 Tax=[Myrmecia] bisecta TaxID=41462 RepID=A0AAW1PQL9_9CHLO
MLAANLSGRHSAGLCSQSAQKQCSAARHLTRYHRRLRPCTQIKPGRPSRSLHAGVRAAVILVPEYQDRVYDPALNSAYWATRPVQVTKRTLQIGAAFSRWLLQSRLQKDSRSDRLTGQQAETLRQILTDLGPAFVKIGQAVSSRPDVVPPDYLRELERLQDQIPPFSDKDAMVLLQRELGAPPSAIFSELTETSIAAASLGQVYKGRLRSTGQLVAVKVQRPGVRESIALDIYILRFLLRQVRKYRKVNSDLPALLDEWASSLFRELDYTQEAANGVRFKKLYGDMEGVYVPDMYLDLTTERVLVMEWVEGVRLRSATQGYSAGMRLDDLKLVEVGVRCSLEQMLEEGYYHSDPHPGNLLRMADGRLAYIDFGMMGEIQAPIRRGLIRATLHMVNREFGYLADDFMTLGLLPPGSDKTEIVPALTRVFEKALGKGVSNLSFGELSGDLGQTMYQYSFRIPPYYTLLVRSLSVLEGIAISSDPNYKTAAARPDQGGQALGLLLSPDGEFVREIMVDELAKGLDASWRLGLDNAVATTRNQLLSLLGAAGKEAEVRDGQYRGLPGALLLESLLALPELSDQEDREQIDGISRLVRQLQQLSPRRGSATATTSTTAVATVPSAGRTSRGVMYPTGTSASTRVSGGAASRAGVGTQATANRGGVAGAGPGSSLPFGSLRGVPQSIADAAEMLQWFLEEARTLPQAARMEALRIPLVLASKVSTRIAARAFRGLLGANIAGQTTLSDPRNGNGKASSRTTASSDLAAARAEPAAASRLDDTYTGRRGSRPGSSSDQQVDAQISQMRRANPSLTGNAGMAGPGSGHSNGAGGSPQAKSPRQIPLSDGSLGRGRNPSARTEPVALRGASLGRTGNGKSQLKTLNGTPAREDSASPGAGQIVEIGVSEISRPVTVPVSVKR